MATNFPQSNIILLRLNLKLEINESKNKNKNIEKKMCRQTITFFHNTRKQIIQEIKKIKMSGKQKKGRK